MIEEGQRRFDNKEYEEALEIFKKAHRKIPNDIQILYMETYCYFKTGNFDEAINGFNKLIELQPENATFYSERGLVFMYQKLKEKSLADFDHAASLEPSNAYRYSSRAFIKDYFGDQQGAIKDYEKAIELDPNDAVSYNNKGIIEEKLGYKEKAQRSYAKADQLPQPQEGFTSPSDVNEIATEIKTSSPFNQKDKDIVAEKPALSVKEYLSTLKKVIFEKEEKEHFRLFLKNLLKGNK